MFRRQQAAPREAVLRRLALAERHVLEGRKIVERQRDLVESRGEDMAFAEQLLDQLERSLATFEEDYRAIRAELEKSK
jgi:hypothetical protein